MKNQDIINFYLDSEVLLSPEVLDILDSTPFPINSKFVVLNKDVLDITTNNIQINIADFEKAIVQKEKHKNIKLYSLFLDYIKNNTLKSSLSCKLDSSINPNSLPINKTEDQTSVQATESLSKPLEKKAQSPTHIIKSELTKSPLTNESELLSSIISKNTGNNIINSPIKFSMSNLEEDSKDIDLEDKDYEKKQREKFFKDNRINIVNSYKTKTRKWSVQDFVSLYNARYKELEKILRSRQELNGLTSVARINSKKERENVAMIGVVYEKAETKAGNIMFTVEDPTGMIKVVVNKNKEDMFRLAQEIQLDEVIGIAGMYDKILFANSLLIPDIPLTKELKKSPEEGYFVIISDTQVGSKLFLDKEFSKFLAWINGEIGNEKQREIASQIKYVFIAGDLVDGVGIYPNQEYDLSIIDIRDQYTAFANLLKQIPDYLPIILCPGNHDVGRISEPQPALTGEYAHALLSMHNVISVSNPAIINIYAQPENGFDGFDVMFYHGFSFVYYSERIPDIRKNGGQKRPDLIMKYLLQRRHLAPSHTSTLYIPDPKKDPLLIDRVPDFLISGHIHRASVSSYKNVTCFNASCWVSQSDEQERRGLEAQPARAFVVNMKTREVKMINFLSKEDQDKEDIKKII